MTDERSPEARAELERIPRVDLREEALAAFDRGDRVEVHEYTRPSGSVWTVAFPDKGRAGQATNGDSVWGEWFPAERAILTDEGIALDFYGQDLAEIGELRDADTNDHIGSPSREQVVASLRATPSGAILVDDDGCVVRERPGRRVYVSW